MNPPEPQPARRRGRKNRAFHDLLAGLAAAACVLAFMLFSSRLGTAAASGETPPSSPPPAASANSASESEQPGVDLETASPQTGQEETPLPEALPWNLRLVNKDNPLPRDFSVETAEAAEGQLDSRAASALSQMVSDMEAQGLSPVVCSSFRTWEEQEALHQNKVNRLLSQGYSPASAEEEASRWVVPAGTSEHQLGLAADIVAADYQVLEEEQENTPEQQWLMAHCQEYGFILRYPRDKQSLTGVGYEPWHYRYVGVEAAQEIMSQGLCLEEYLGQA